MGIINKTEDARWRECLTMVFGLMDTWDGRFVLMDRFVHDPKKMKRYWIYAHEIREAIEENSLEKLEKALGENKEAWTMSLEFSGSV